MHVYPVDTHSLLIQWDEMTGDSFQLEKSTSPEGPFEVIAAHLSVPLYVDKEVNLFEVGLKYYYKVKSFINGEPVDESMAISAEYNKRDYIANKIIYENRVLLRVMKNLPVFILLRERSGKECFNCINPITKRPRFSDCRQCNGTGVHFGFHSPIQTLISRDMSQEMNYTSLLDSKKVNETLVSAWITNYPKVSPGDVIVDTLNQRFLIQSVAPRTKSQYLIRQVLSLVPLEKGHPAYQTEVDILELREF